MSDDAESLHTRIKKRIHSFRIPLSKRGQRIAGAVYFVLPIVGGYYIMRATTNYSEAHKNEWMTSEHQAKVRALQQAQLQHQQRPPLQPSQSL